MKRVVLVLVVMVGGCGAPEDVAEGPVEWGVFATVEPAPVEPEPATVQVGEDLLLTLTARHPPDADFTSPYGNAFGPFELIERTEEAVSPTETNVRYRLGAYFLPEDVNIPSLQVQYRDEAGEPVTLHSSPIAVRVVTSLTPDVTDIHDIKEPMALTLPRRLGPLLWLLLALLAAFLAYLLYKKFHKEPEEAEARSLAPPPPPPYEEAKAALHRLAERKLLEKGETLPFYEALANIMKRYAGRSYDVAYLERTTFEILHDLRASRLPHEAYQELRAVLEASDLVKFARVLPDRGESERTLATAESCVERTRPAPPAPAESTEPVEPVGVGA